LPETPLFWEIASLDTEKKNPATENIDLATTTEVLEMISNQDMLVADAVRSQLPYISTAVDTIVDSFRRGGRLFYFGAGTSGRLGIVDAAECPPTFGTPPDMVQGIIAGGSQAVFQAQEGAEDDPNNGSRKVIELGISPPDIVCGLAASGRTPFVRGALDEAARRGVFTILIATVSRDLIAGLGVKADVIICPDVGPEVIAGSTRMKSGTAQKLVLNMISTAAMIQLGKTYGNIMVDLQQTNAKLKERSKRILMNLTGVDYDSAEKYLTDSKGNVKAALVMILAGVDLAAAESLLARAGGFVRRAIELK